MNQDALITFSLTPPEADVVLNALGQRPFAEVHRLVAKLIQQANAPQPAPEVPTNG